MAWAFATRLDHTILLEIGKPQGKMHNRVRLQNINHTAALHLLGSLRSLTRMADLMEIGFEKDQALANCIVKYSVEHQSSASDMTAFDAKIEALERRVANKYATTTSLGTYAKKSETLAKTALAEYAKKTDNAKFVTHNSLTKKLKGYATK